MFKQVLVVCGQPVIIISIKPQRSSPIPHIMSINNHPKLHTVVIIYTYSQQRKDETIEIGSSLPFTISQYSIYLVQAVVIK